MSSIVRTPPGVTLRPWNAADFPAIQALSAAEGWTTPAERPEASLASWKAANPAIVAEADGEIIGFLRALSDGAVTTYVAELLVAPAWRGRGLGRALLDACQALVRIRAIMSRNSSRSCLKSAGVVFGIFRSVTFV
jgi:ribosomal protein S18 acetylase RimI-like enzyme